VGSSEVRGEKAEAGTATLICFAVKEEAAPFQKKSGCFPSAKILVTGMGRKNTERAILQSLAKEIPTLVLTCGFGGALDPELKIGDVVFDADEESGISGLLKEAGAEQAEFYCAPRVAVAVAEKTALRKSTGADVVEMESGVIREICRQKNIPSATIRAVSDAAHDDLPLDFNALMTANDAISFPKLALALMKSPGKIPQLMQLQKNTQAAAAELAKVLEKLLSRLGR